MHKSPTYLIPNSFDEFRIGTHLGKMVAWFWTHIWCKTSCTKRQPVGQMQLTQRMDWQCSTNISCTLAVQVSDHRMHPFWIEIKHCYWLCHLRRIPWSVYTFQFSQSILVCRLSSRGPSVGSQLFCLVECKCSQGNQEGSWKREFCQILHLDRTQHTRLPMWLQRLASLYDYIHKLIFWHYLVRYSYS